jgi:ketosteroid isomerase-like protein
MFLILALFLGFQVRADGAASPQPDVGDPVAELDARFVSDLHDKKIDDMLKLYTADATFVNPDGTEATGPGLRKLYEQVTTAYDSDLHLKQTGLKRSINTMIEDGTYTEALGHRSTGKIDQISGTYRFTLHRDLDGTWRYSRMEWH